MCNRGGNCHVPYLTINWLELKSTPHSCTLKHRTTILISSAHNIINDYSKLFIVATPNKTIKILPYLVTRAKSPLLVHISRSIDAFATAKQPYESSWSVQSPETIEKCSFTFSRAQEPRTWDLMRRNLKSPDSIFRLILFFGDDGVPSSPKNRMSRKMEYGKVKQRRGDFSINMCSIRSIIWGRYHEVRIHPT